MASNTGVYGWNHLDKILIHSIRGFLHPLNPVKFKNNLINVISKQIKNNFYSSVSLEVFVVYARGE